MFPRNKLPVLNVPFTHSKPVFALRIRPNVFMWRVQILQLPFKTLCQKIFARSAKKILGWMKTYISDFMIF